MKLRNILTVLGTAALTVVSTLTLVTLQGEGVAQADPPVKPILVRPVLKSQGCTFVLTTDKASYEAGESPVLEVAATNPSDRPASVTVWVTVSSMAPTSLESRMLPKARTVWSKEFAFSFKAGESTSMRATCEAKLPAGQIISILLSDHNASVLAAQLGVQAQGGPNLTQNGGPAAKQ